MGLLSNVLRRAAQAAHGIGQRLDELARSREGLPPAGELEFPPAEEHGARVEITPEALEMLAQPTWVEPDRSAPVPLRGSLAERRARSRQ